MVFRLAFALIFSFFFCNAYAQTALGRDVLVIFHEQADVSGARQIHGKNAKAIYVFNQLTETAYRTQGAVRQLIQENGAEGNSLYIVNAIAVKNCSPELEALLAARPEVKSVSYDPWIEFPQPAELPISHDRNAIEWGVEKIQAPAVWAQGYSGQGVTIGGADTGYDWVHPAIKPKYRGYYAPTDTFNHNYNWHDAIHTQSPLNGDPNNPCGYDIDAPCDDQSHGTHTMGTMVGGDGQGAQIGVAPEAQWVGCRNMERGWGQPSTYLECFEWFLAPTDVDGLNPNPAKAPHVINNSWYCADNEGCTDVNINETLRQAVINLKAAGVVVVVSNGNFGSFSCSTTYGPPAYFEESFSIGATDINDQIAGFSSVGPVTIDGSNRVKPNVVAPGVNVLSCTPNNGYASFSGTSMAGPHVAGLVALIFSARPDLAGEVETIEDLIESTCLPLTGNIDCEDNNGQNLPNNTFGYGLVNAYDVVEKALTVDLPICTAPHFGVLVYPNPVGKEALFLIEYQEETAMIDLYSSDGKLVRASQVALARNGVTPMDLSGLPSGLYFWSVNVGGAVKTGTLVKS